MILSSTRHHVTHLAFQIGMVVEVNQIVVIEYVPNGTLNEL